MLALGLDLILRRDFADLTLDDFMGLVWERHGKSEHPYSNSDLEKILAELTKDQLFARTFFANYIHGSELPDFSELLKPAGFRLQKANPDEAWIGPLAFDFKDEKMTANRSTIIGSPLYNAGIDREDVILSIADTSFADLDELKAFIAKRNLGDVVQVKFEKNGVERAFDLTFFEDPSYEVAPFEHENKAVSDSAESFRNAWLESQSGLTGDEIIRYCPECQRAFPFRFEYCRFDGEQLKLTQEGEGLINP